MSEVFKDWVDYHARHRPEAIALADVDSQQELTWAQFEQRVGRVAAVLGELGIGRGDRVALMVENDLRIFEIQFACMRIGALMMPLNWRLAPAELTQMLIGGAPGVLIHDDQWAEVATGLAAKAGIAPVLAWGDRDSSYEQALAAGTHSVPGGELELDAPVQLLYTSGTTGLPKGVVCTNRTIWTQALNLAHSSRMAEPGGHHLNVNPLFHAGGLNVFTLPIMIWGGRVTTVRRFDAAQALRLLTDVELGLTHMCGVLQMYEWITALPEFGSAHFPAARAMLFGGWGPSAVGIYRAWAERGVWTQLSYGASELGPNVAILSEPDPTAAERGTSGTILPHTRVQIVDDAGDQVPTGESGEILVSGPGVVPGYWKQPRERYFTGEWFHTGDLGRLDPAGQLYIIGRLKEVYRSGGENIYPAEVERVLTEMPAIAEMAVLGIPHERWGETGLAAVVCQPGQSVTLEQIQAYAEGKLARYKIPSALYLVDSLPRRATQKISRPAIRESWERRVRSETEAETKTEAEQQPHRV
jgi:fatty-acyl-CoA synthase